MPIYKIDKNFTATKKIPQKLIQNIMYGAYISYALDREDAGQTVVVKNKTIMAVESFEGRYETILRGSSLSNGKSCVVIMNKLSIDEKESVVIDTEFLIFLKEHNVDLLAFEENVFIEEKEKFINIAKKLKISLLFFNKENVLKAMNKGN